MKAAKLLLQKRIGVFDVAQYIGYFHSQTFYRAFQRRFGCTPATLCRRPSPKKTSSVATGGSQTWASKPF
jgi:AraC-like DNA-binding protein